jgi:CubicO group peptidase (beta-lactamase class C family)
MTNRCSALISVISRESAIVAWLLLFVPAYGMAQSTVPANRRFDSVREVIREVMEEKAIPSVSVAVAKDGRIVWEEGFGWADREKLLPATPNTMYSLASISKPFTATGLMRLAEQGKVELDKPANEYLGLGQIRGLAGSASAATVRRVLSHTAGLPHHVQFFYINEPYRPPSMEETIARYGIVVYTPGQEFEYSNLGFGIADHIVTRVSGEDFADYMRKEVFAPLGLTHTSVDIGPGLEAYVAQRYDAQLRPIPFYTFDHVGASAIYSSAHDLVRFGMFHLKDHLADQQAILKDSTVDQMQQEVISIHSTFGYALGWFTNSNDHGYRFVGHTGGMPGVSTMLALIPSENLAVVVLTNSEADSSKIRKAVLGSMLPKYAEALLHDSSEATAKPEPFLPPTQLLGSWVGTVQTWQGKIPFSMTFQPDGDIHVKLGDNFETLLNEASFRNGTLAGSFASSIPTPDVNLYRSQVELKLWLQGETLGGQVTAVTPTDPEHYALSSYAELARKTSGH